MTVITRWRLVLGTAIVLSLAGISWSAPAQGAPEIVEVLSMRDLRVAGHPGVEKDYKYLREPNAVVTSKGTIIVAAGPHHLRARNDRALQDILCRISADGGRTWSEITMIADHGLDSVLPTTLVCDGEKDRVLLVYNVIFNDPDRPKDEKKPCQQFVIRSDDEGKSWSAPREILKGTGKICVFGGGSGFQLTAGPNKGRLVIPGGIFGKSGIFFSDDHGGTWDFKTIPGSGRFEATGCEVAPGEIMFCRRKGGYGMQTVFSRDGGDSWGEQVVALPDAWASCNNSALSVTIPGGERVTIVGAPLGPEKVDRYLVEKDAKELKRGEEDSLQKARSNGGVFASLDDGKTWPIGVAVAPGWIFGYNALVELPDGDIGLVFEGSRSGLSWQGAKRDHNTGTALGIYMVRFSVEWLLGQQGKSGPSDG